MTTKQIMIGEKYKNNLAYNIGTFLYRLVLVNPNYAFKDLGFWSKTKLDLMYKLGVKINYIKTKHYTIYGNGGLWVLYEEGYNEIKDCDNVLDLGGYIGDSALELARHNENVYVFEPDYEKFDYILKNIEVNSMSNKIIPFNKAVVDNDDEYTHLYYRSNVELDGAASISAEPGSSYDIVKCINISEVLKMARFDGLKCDIEGGEWPLINYFMKDNFNFKMGTIELHFSSDAREFEILTLKQFMELLDDRGYDYYFYIIDKEINIKEYLSSLNDMDFKDVALMIHFSADVNDKAKEGGEQ